MDLTNATLYKRLVTVEEAAAYVRCAPRTIRRYVSSGAIAGFRVGPRMLRVDLNEVDAMLRPIPTAGGGPSAA